MAVVIITEHLLYGLRYSSHGFLPLNAGSRYLDISTLLSQFFYKQWKRVKMCLAPQRWKSRILKSTISDPSLSSSLATCCSPADPSKTWILNDQTPLPSPEPNSVSSVNSVQWLTLPLSLLPWFDSGVISCFCHWLQDQWFWLLLDVPSSSSWVVAMNLEGKVA